VGAVPATRSIRLPLAVLVLMIVWGCAVLAAPWLAAAPSGSLRVVAASGVYLLGGAVCHQRAERSFHVRGAQAPVCGRCEGVYVSAAMAAVLTLAVARSRIRWDRLVTRSVVIAAALPTALGWGLESVGWMDGTPAVRAALAVPLGIAVALLVAAWNTAGMPVPHEVN
jgi:uncharacterized membrane protein